MDNFTNPGNNTQNTEGDTYSYDYSASNVNAGTTQADTTYSQPGTFTGESAAWQANNQAQEQQNVYSEQYTNQYGNPEGGYTAAPQKKGGMIGIAIASLVCGILAILCCCFGIWSWLLAIPGIVLGIVAVVKKYAGKGCAIAGIICSALAIVLSIVMIIWTAAAGSSIMDSLDDYGYSTDYYDYY